MPESNLTHRNASNELKFDREIKFKIFSISTQMGDPSLFQISRGQTFLPIVGLFSACALST
jgi:hypothetical protein